jgi:dimethylargininase
MFTHAIVRTPCPEMVDGITSVKLGRPDYSLALEQHQEYVEALRSLGLKITILEPDSRYPDSTFVEDVVLCTSGFSVITNPGVVSRKGEKENMERVLGSYYDVIEYIHPPGTLEAGDVMMAGNHFYTGISQRTNQEGADQLIRILEKHKLKGEKVELKNLLHLKSGISYLENNNLLIGKELFDHPAFNDFGKISVGKDEDYAANSLWVNGTVLVPEGFPETRRNIEQAGYPTISLAVSEFEKLDGGLSCLSLRF